MWDYSEANRLLTLESVTAAACIFCRYEMLRLPAQKFEAGSKTLLAQISICRCCGWWSAYRVHQGEHARTAGIAEGYSGTLGCLKELDLNDVSVPLEAIRQHLAAKSDSIFNVHPRLFEDVVCGVFRDLGWQARATAYSGDDGIDVVLDGPEDCTIGVQVKRYRRERRIEAEQIRSFAGALLLKGHTKGVFVTTSDFRRGARRAASEYAAIGFPIELVNAKQFLKALGIAQIRTFQIDADRLVRYILGTCHHIGSGIHKEFVAGEDLTARPIAIQAFTRDELLSQAS
ncbi:MAG TPA: restriction endonuclease [Thermoanaerobaculia bacterium]|nr:restriction endonuclease [Thermoanaerobaculia bacterium]